MEQGLKLASHEFMDCSKMSKMELRKMVNKKGIDASSSASKTDLVTLLKEAALSEYHASSALPHENEDTDDDLEEQLPSFTAGEYVDPLCHIGDSTFDFTSIESDVKDERAIHSRIGWRERCHERNEAKKEKRNNKIQTKNTKEVEELRGRGLFPCDETDPETLMRCTALFLTEDALLRHKSTCESGGKHMFPSINSLSKITYDASRGLLDPLNLMVGKRVNRDSGVYNASSERLETSQTPLPMCQECSGTLDCTRCNGVSSLCTGEGCLRRDFSLLKKRVFRASPELVKDLEALFLKGEYRDKDDDDTSKQKIKAAKYTHIEAVAVLHNMKGVDGRRKYRKGGQFGPLPTTNYVRSWFSNRKRKGAKGLLSKKDDHDDLHGITISSLKEKFYNLFNCKATSKTVLQKLLEVDDLLQDSGHDNAYSSLSVTNLEKECKDRNLPHSMNANSLKIVLRAHMKQDSQIENNYKIK